VCMNKKSILRVLELEEKKCKGAILIIGIELGSVWPSLFLSLCK
jgi:hypothetical protein